MIITEPVGLRAAKPPADIFAHTKQNGVPQMRGHHISYSVTDALLMEILWLVPILWSPNTWKIWLPTSADTRFSRYWSLDWKQLYLMP